MREILQGATVASFVANRCGTVFAEPYAALGFASDGTIEGGIVFNGYTGRNVDISVANDLALWPPAFVRYFGDYLWNKLNVDRVTMIVRPENEHMCLRMGAKREGVLRSWYPDSDGILCGLLKSEWKFDR